MKYAIVITVITNREKTVQLLKRTVLQLSIIIFEY